ncbi:protoporphyrinogen oxidase [Fervidibacillus halotolerans]|uniref:Coproporphyrinogen III oxidase n=1 Tax=Fervidibacillus halotolerans TaxID=2980027 RepID=A0A9E8LZS8_9BACI|nr:protoporphyrinogen oxidase [Fervidibacillus halotolerans]WAA12730.1 protoporphyrinogen oxidase [Fervidibacillus halotolerans]
MDTVLVIGGGITGLSALFELQKWKRNTGYPVRLILTEASSSMGGKIRTVKESGFIMETGADSIVTRKIIDHPLFHELELKQETVFNHTGISFIYTNGQLVEIPKDSVFGIPITIESLAKSQLISDRGKVAALKDLYVEDNPFTEQDSIGDFLEYYFGEELVKKQVSPVLSGVFSGELKELSIQSTLPFVYEYKNKYGSIMKGLEKNKHRFIRKEKEKFLSFERGLSTIIDKLVDQLEDVEIFQNWQAVKIEKLDRKYKVHFSNGKQILADRLILSISHLDAEKLFDDSELRTYFSNIRTKSIISVYLGLNVTNDALPKNGTGFITEKGSDLLCGACTWTSRKWIHTSKSGNLLLRMFYKSSHPRYDYIEKLSDEQLVELARNDLKNSMGISAQPIVSNVKRWENQLTVYDLNHSRTVSHLRETLKNRYPGIYVSGSSYDGGGIPDCINGGINSAKQLMSEIVGTTVEK